jgi:hypothetical protein
MTLVAVPIVKLVEVDVRSALAEDKVTLCHIVDSEVSGSRRSVRDIMMDFIAKLECRFAKLLLPSDNFLNALEEEQEAGLRTRITLDTRYSALSL